MTPITPAKELIARLTLDDMLELNKYLVGQIKEKRTEKGRAIKSSLGYSDKVSFVNSKTGVRLHGEIVKVMRKYAKVNVPGGPFGQQWRVPLSMLCKE
jgi:hypothetical protein|tara:strand:+ start:1999 stop:2292 length:294 start_codon:yes stop_codon:yes gene_type:complete